MIGPVSPAAPLRHFANLLTAVLFYQLLKPADAPSLYSSVCEAQPQRFSGHLRLV